MGSYLDVSEGPYTISVASGLARAPERSGSIKATPCHCAGFFAIPGALTTLEQQQLAHDALAVFPEPPATTNLTAQYGRLPQGLWDATELGLSLKRYPPQEARGCAVATNCSREHSSKAPRPLPYHAEAEQTLLPHSTMTVGCAPGAPDSMRGPAVPGTPMQPAAQPCQGAAGCSQHSGAVTTLAAKASNGDEHLCTTAAVHHGPSDSCDWGWGSHGTGPAARDLLLKLRWATLGLPYDWTARSYDHSALQQSIPRYLQDIAVRLMGLAWEAGGSSGLEGWARQSREDKFVSKPPGDAMMLALMLSSQAPVPADIRGIRA